MSRGLKSRPQLSELILNSYPSCDHCMSWSEDGLVVATNENVYLVQKRMDAMSKDAEPWSTSALRVDQFTYDEWPERPLATVEDFSVGEEQSDSVAVSALWSSSGVGMHRRCVLGVLTSNLLFSIWETNGFDRGWRRTYILNHLPRIESASTQSASLPKRWRIRAFAWSAPLKKSEEDRWGEQFLIVADSDDNLTLLSVRKARRGQYGTWEVHAICTTSLKSSDRTSAGRVVPKSLHSQITRGSSIERLEMHDWNIATSGHRPDNGRLIATARITYRTSNSHTPSSVSVTLTCSQGHIDGTFGPSSHDTDSAMTSSLAGIDVAAQRLKKEPQWLQALDDCCDAYRKTYELNVSRYRLWTLAVDPAGMYEVACVTLHPVEAFEYTSAIQEKTRLIFTRRNSANLPRTTQQNLKDVDQVLASSLQVVTKCGGDPNSLSTDIDRTMIQLFYTAAGYSNQYEDERVLLREMLEFQPNADVGVIGSDAQNVRALGTPAHPSQTPGVETCSVCSATINLTSDLGVATCTSGHVFVRCSLSLLSIQEPAISKYCSGCSRQFLNPLKLGPLPTRSVVSRLLDEFDTCPYCGGRYRG